MNDVHVTCANCGIQFCLPEAVDDSRREDHKSFYCPSGHKNYYPHETEKEKQIRLLKRAVEVRDSMIQGRDFRIERLEREVRSLRSKLAWARRRQAA